MAKFKNGNKPSVFIDGEAGTTGLEIRNRLADTNWIELVSIDPGARKDASARKALMAQADVVILCLPDEAAIEAVALANGLGAASPRIIDASTAHRVTEGWVYGFPELSGAQAARVASAKRVTNPGCYPTGAIALVRPLVDAGLMPNDYPLTVNAVSGYSGGGKTMIESYGTGKAPAFELYGLGLSHKHVPEIQAHSGLTRRPIFVPSVGNYRQGMLVSVPLHLNTLKGSPSLRDLEAVYAAHYAGSAWVNLVSLDAAARKAGRLEPEGLNASNKMELYVYGDDAVGQAVLVARLDNLGKGASGAAVQSLRLMVT